MAGKLAVQPRTVLCTRKRVWEFANQPDFALAGPRLLALALPVGHHSFSLLLLDHHLPRTGLQRPALDDL